MDYTVVKAAMRSIGQAVSDGSNWSASDSSLFRDFSQFTLNVNAAHATGILRYPENFPKAWAKINELAGEDPQEAGQESPQATFAAPVVDTPASEVEAPAEAPSDVPAEAPADQEAEKEAETPADPEQNATDSIKE